MGNNNTTCAPLRPGTRVKLDDGSIGTASPNLRIGKPWDGTYVVRQPNLVTGGTFVSVGLRRDQLEVVP